jgi:pimeloyl-ACP methyl ester carboxylesterase
MSVKPPNDGLFGLAPVEHRFPAGIMPNARHQTFHGFMSGASYQLAIVEFDDQGRCYDRGQIDAVADRLDAMRVSGEDVILLVFVHGWKHDARSDDANLSSFRQVLTQTAVREKEASSGGGTPRPVMGVFVGWRGLTTYDPTGWAANTTFWGRQEAGHRVATGSVRELFGRLRHYRNSRRKHGGTALLVIAGHSFGGMIVFSALAQSLIEAASVPVGHVVPRFADLVLLANPAIEGARYIPIQDLVDGFGQRTIKQLPVFVCVQAENDQAVGKAFPIGNFKNGLTEASIGDLERRCITHAIGFIDQFRTHRLTGPADGKPFVLSPGAIQQENPFWVVRAAKAVIDGHGGIWQAPFLSFLAGVIFLHVAASKSAGAAGEGAPMAMDVTAGVASQASGDLADYAATIPPIAIGEG